MEPHWKLTLEALATLASLGLAVGRPSSGWISQVSAVVDRTGGRGGSPTVQGGGWTPQQSASPEGWTSQTVVDPGGGWMTQVTMPFGGSRGETFKPPSSSQPERTSSEDRATQTPADSGGNWFSWITLPLVQLDKGTKVSDWTSQSTPSSEEWITRSDSMTQNMASQDRARTYTVPGGWISQKTRSPSQPSVLPAVGAWIVEAKLLPGSAKAADGWISQNTESSIVSSSLASPNSNGGWITQATMPLGGERGRANVPGSWISQTAASSEDFIGQTTTDAGSGWMTQRTSLLGADKGQASKRPDGWMARENGRYEDMVAQTSTDTDGGWITLTSGLLGGEGTKRSKASGDRTSQISWLLDRKTKPDHSLPQMIPLNWNEPIPVFAQSWNGQDLDFSDYSDLRNLKGPFYEYRWANPMVTSDWYTQTLEGNSDSPKLLFYFLQSGYPISDRGRETQYNLYPSRDEYLFKYALSDGTLREERGFFNQRGIWTQEGRVTWVDPEGNSVTTYFRADDKGYSAKGGDTWMMRPNIG